MSERCTELTCPQHGEVNRRLHELLLPLRHDDTLELPPVHYPWWLRLLDFAKWRWFG